jgi:hypothetical protein
MHLMRLGLAVRVWFAVMGTQQKMPWRASQLERPRRQLLSLAKVQTVQTVQVQQVYLALQPMAQAQSETSWR